MTTHAAWLMKAYVQVCIFSLLTGPGYLYVNLAILCQSQVSNSQAHWHQRAGVNGAVPVPPS